MKTKKCKRQEGRETFYTRSGIPFLLNDYLLIKIIIHPSGMLVLQIIVFILDHLKFFLHGM